MGRLDPAGFAGDTLDGDLNVAEAWAHALESADIADDYAGALEMAGSDAEDVEDDLAALVARRPSRRARMRQMRCRSRRFKRRRSGSAGRPKAVSRG